MTWRVFWLQPRNDDDTKGTVTPFHSASFRREADAKTLAGRLIDDQCRCIFVRPPNSHRRIDGAKLREWRSGETLRDTPKPKPCENAGKPDADPLQSTESMAGNRQCELSATRPPATAIRKNGP